MGIERAVFPNGVYYRNEDEVGQKAADALTAPRPQFYFETLEEGIHDVTPDLLRSGNITYRVLVEEKGTGLFLVTSNLNNHREVDFISIPETYKNFVHLAPEKDGEGGKIMQIISYIPPKKFAGVRRLFQRKK